MGRGEVRSGAHRGERSKVGQGMGSPKLKVSTNVALSGARGGATAEKAELWNEASGCVARCGVRAEGWKERDESILATGYQEGLPKQ